MLFRWAPPPARRRTEFTGTPFALDTWLYVPLCAFLAVASLLVAAQEP